MEPMATMQMLKRIADSMFDLCASLLQVIVEEGVGPTRQWSQLFRLYYGDLLDGPEWKRSIRGLGLRGGDEESTLLVMYTAYALTMKGLRNHVINHRLHPEPAPLQSALFSDAFLAHLHLKPGHTDDLFSWPLAIEAEEVVAALERHGACIQAADPCWLLSSVDSNRPFSKTIFQQFFPTKVRHQLGEYYTPKWLAQLSIEQVLAKGEPVQSRRFLDPSCGSGVFLVDLIHRLAEGDNRSIHDITSRVFGIDINPVAVVASTANYVLALLSARPEALLRNRVPLEIPVYFGDSMLQPTQLRDNLYSIATGQGDIRYRTSGNADDIRPSSEDLGLDHAESTYAAAQHQLTQLHTFTDLVGNPPWISWEHISQTYKVKMRATFLETYSLYQHSGYDSTLGMGHDDICVPFLLICADRFLSEHGRISFLMKQSIYQGEAHGLFRTLQIRTGSSTTSLCLERVLDLSSGNPFASSGAATSLAVLTKNAETTFPVQYRKYDLNTVGKDHVHLTLTRVLQACAYEDFDLLPEPSKAPTSPWLILPKGAKIQSSGQNAYPVRHGYVNDLASVFFVEVKGKTKHGILINASNSGRKKVAVVDVEVEPDRVYPGLKARHIRKWKIIGHQPIIVPQDKYTDDNEASLRSSSPRLLAYLRSHQTLLLGRRSVHIREKPFYSTFGVGPYTFAPHKVVFNAMGSIKQSFCVVGDIHSPHIGSKTAIPHNNICCISLRSREEAHFVCGVLNSEWVAGFVSTRAGRSKYPWAAKMMKAIPLPKYDPVNSEHKAVAALSVEIHKLARLGTSFVREETQLNEAVHRILG
ncbi:MAG: hypothetical protein CL927_08850 [Deltaproteobacteria bacterium]|nr:hypothetical protein [Deltaproteobacteria bacterium]HCH66706.1 hypothetical protein [Deltaproteobacteria bacterium]